MEQWSLTQNQPLLKTLFLKPPIISYQRGKSLTCCLIKNLTLRLSCEVVAKTTRGIRAGLVLSHKYSTCVVTRYEIALINNFETHGASYQTGTAFIFSGKVSLKIDRSGLLVQVIDRKKV